MVMVLKWCFSLCRGGAELIDYSTQYPWSFGTLSIIMATGNTHIRTTPVPVHVQQCTCNTYKPTHVCTYMYIYNMKLPIYALKKIRVYIYDVVCECVCVRTTVSMTLYDVIHTVLE